MIRLFTLSVYAEPILPVPAKALDGLDGVYIINLKRRPDRLAAFWKSSGLSSDSVHVVEAVDGSQITEWNDLLEEKFSRNKMNSVATLFACALSHYKLWKHIG